MDEWSNEKLQLTFFKSPLIHLYSYPVHPVHPVKNKLFHLQCASARDWEM